MYYENPEANDDRQYDQYCLDNNWKSVISNLEKLAEDIKSRDYTYAIAPAGCNKYLTENKKYKIINKSESTLGHFSFKIKDNDGYIISCFNKNCFHAPINDWIFE